MFRPMENRLAKVWPIFFLPFFCGYLKLVSVFHKEYRGYPPDIVSGWQIAFLYVLSVFLNGSDLPHGLLCGKSAGVLYAFKKSEYGFISS